MKKGFLIFTASLMTITLFAQSEKYVKAMEALIPAVDTTQSKDVLMALGNSFERIATAEKNQWLPFYYAALVNITAGFTFSDGSFSDKSAEVDPIADKSEGFLNKAEELSKDNSEIWLARKMLASLRMIANAMVRFQQYAPIAATALETAKKLNPGNPRVYLLEGQDLFFTPEQYGGDKQEAKKRFEEALKKYDSFKPESSIHPSWGLGQTRYFLSQIK